MALIHLCTKFGESRFSRIGDRYDCRRQNWKWVMWPPFKGGLSSVS